MPPKTFLDVDKTLLAWYIHSEIRGTLRRRHARGKRPHATRERPGLFFFKIRGNLRRRYARGKKPYATRERPGGFFFLVYIGSQEMNIIYLARRYDVVRCRWECRWMVLLMMDILIHRDERTAGLLKCLYVVVSRYKILSP